MVWKFVLPVVTSFSSETAGYYEFCEFNKNKKKTVQFSISNSSKNKFLADFDVKLENKVLVEALDENQTKRLLAASTAIQ